jgi:hypothetical protein
MPANLGFAFAANVDERHHRGGGRRGWAFSPAGTSALAPTGDF